MKIFVFLFISIFIGIKANGIDYIFDFNSNCHLAYRQLMSLQSEQAKATINAELIAHPNNLIPIYLSDYADCLELLFNGDETKLSVLKKHQEERALLLEKGENKSPWFRFCKANMQLHWALVHLRFGDQFKAALKFRKSFLLLKENKEMHPSFEENKVLFGLEQAIAGTIPENYKWISGLLGIKGNVNKGISELSQYLNAHKEGNGAMQEEAMIYYAYLKFYLQSQQETAWRYINGMQFNEENNLMRCFIKANLALNYRKSEIAFSILKKAELIKGFEEFPIFKYELAESMIARLDPKCNILYEQFLKNYKGKHFVKDALLKMAWMSFLQENMIEANAILTQIKVKGIATSDADKQALRFASKPIWPKKSLLEIRLLIDGGYYQKALGKIQAIDKKQLGEVQNVLEYNFRYGRIFEELKMDDKALMFYNATIQIGRDKKEYYAARSALHQGFIYERQGNSKRALESFQNCLSMRNHDFQSSIDQLAKAGINRLSP
jgi:hypothetical protein